ncbi:hypothetical protein NUW54_g4508 [Trametes sanguinea]|uniref:Uncharacterized protein n=1 Tax=Trametes sanguinea TaxID=158606 RepID=A0ACC1Q0S6_9APHY|nr:hypothetical protein NUW54_g4508 [Trametes sanguinea]
MELIVVVTPGSICMASALRIQGVQHTGSIGALTRASIEARYSDRADKVHEIAPTNHTGGDAGRDIPSIAFVGALREPSRGWGVMAPSLSENAAAVLAEPSPGVPGTLSALTESLGAILLGTIFGSMLYGLMLHQTYRYWRLYPNDKFILKGLVASIVVMETFHMVLWIIVCYEFLIVDYLNPLKIVSHQPWFLVLTIPMVVVAAAISQAAVGPQYRPLVFVAVSVMLMAIGEQSMLSAGIGTSLRFPHVKAGALLLPFRRQWTIRAAFKPSKYYILTSLSSQGSREVDAAVPAI